MLLLNSIHAVCSVGGVKQFGRHVRNELEGVSLRICTDRDSGAGLWSSSSGCVGSDNYQAHTVAVGVAGEFDAGVLARDDNSCPGDCDATDNMDSMRALSHS